MKAGVRTTPWPVRRMPARGETAPPRSSVKGGSGEAEAVIGDLDAREGEGGSAAMPAGALDPVLLQFRSERLTRDAERFGRTRLVPPGVGEGHLDRHALGLGERGDASLVVEPR